MVVYMVVNYLQLNLHVALMFVDMNWILKIHPIFYRTYVQINNIYFTLFKQETN